MKKLTKEQVKAKFKVIEKKIKLGKIKISYTEINGRIFVFVDFGRYKKCRNVNTSTIYDAIVENHKSWDEVWLDIQDKKATGIEIHLSDKMKGGKNGIVKS